MDIVTYALLKKRITSALSGVKDIKLEGERTIMFTTNDGTPFKINIPTPDLVYVGDIEPPRDSEYELWIDTSNEGTTPLNRALLSDDIVASTVIGSVTSGKTYPVGTNLEDILRDILTSYSKPTVTLSIDPNTDVYDVVTDTLDQITAIAKVTKGTKTIESITFFIDGVEIEQITRDVSGGGTFSNTQIFTPPKNKTFTLKVTANDGTNKVTATKDVVFIGRSYHGTVGKEITVPTEEDIKGLQFNTLKNSRNLIYQNIQVTYGKVLYAYPKSLGAITKIVDSENRDYTNSYTMGEVEVDGIPYYYCLLTKAIGTDNGYQKFS